jgi:hypothetical protein
MVLAIHIWLKLRKSIPLQYRKYYSLLPDPAAGKVTVVARTPSLELPGLWPTKVTIDHLGKVPLQRRKTALPTLADHLAFIPISPAVPTLTALHRAFSDVDSVASFQSFRIARQRLLGRTWMTLVDQCSLSLGSPQDDVNTHGTKLEREEDDEVRFAVESDMNANEPTPLRMNWAQFVWLSLALGVNPQDPAFYGDYPCTLKDSQGNASTTISRATDSFWPDC